MSSKFRRLAAATAVLLLLAACSGPSQPLSANAPAITSTTPVTPTSNTPAAYPDGIPRELDGEHVYRASDAAAVASGSQSFLVGGWIGYGPSCPSASFPGVSASQLEALARLVTCENGTDLRDTPALPRSLVLYYRFRNPTHLDLPRPGAVVVRVHADDPQAPSCPGGYRATCHAAIVLEAVLWRRSGT